MWARFDYAFCHHLVQAVLYDDTPTDRRQRRHRRVARVMEDLYPDALDELSGTIGWHYEQGGEGDQAIPWYRRAGENAARLYANDEAVAYLTRALELLPEQEEAERYPLLFAREAIHDLQGNREAQGVDLADLERLAVLLGDPAQEAAVGVRRAHYAEATGDCPAAIALARDVVAQAGRISDVRTEAAGRLQWGSALWQLGDYAAARPQLVQALALARAAGARGEEAESHGFLGNVSWSQGGYAEAQEHYEQSLAIHRAAGDRQGEIRVLNRLAAVRHDLGDPAGALDYLEQVVRLARAIGSRLGEGNALNGLGNVSYSMGDFRGARDYYAQALELYRAIGYRAGEGFALNGIGNATWGFGDVVGARAYFEAALRIARELGDPRAQGFALNGLGSVCVELGDFSGARDYFGQVLGVFRAIGGRQDEGMVLANIGFTWFVQGNAARSQDCYEQALAIAREVEDRQDEILALAGLGNALTARGRWDEAIASFRQALGLLTGLPLEHVIATVQADLARATLGAGDLPTAYSLVGEVLAFLDGGGQLEGGEDTLRVLLTCHNILRAGGAPRARDILGQARALLQERAARIADPVLRQSFLDAVPDHCEILQTWEGLSGE
jgi:tetratricopeptide (TPR) repeat protein